MQITRTLIENGFVEIVLSDGTEGGASIVVRLPQEAGETDSLAFHRLTTLQKVRDVIGSEIQAHKRTLDQAS